MTYKCSSCKKGRNIVIIKTGISAPVIPHPYASVERVAQAMNEKIVLSVLGYIAKKNSLSA